MPRKIEPRVVSENDRGVYFIECDVCSTRVCVIGVANEEVAIGELTSKYYWTTDRDGYLLCPKCSENDPRG